MTGLEFKSILGNENISGHVVIWFLVLLNNDMPQAMLNLVNILIQAVEKGKNKTKKQLKCVKYCITFCTVM